MPELPDIELYVLRLRERLVGQRLLKFRPFNPFVLRSVSPKASELTDRELVDVWRMGKRIVLEFSGEFFAVIHLMIAGRLAWKSPLPPEPKAMGKLMLAAFRFENGQLTLQEVSTKKRASIMLFSSREALEEQRRSGLDVFTATAERFGEILRAKNRTLKRALTDPNAFDGIGNAYSDEILFAARLSPVRLTGGLSDEEVVRLHEASKSCLAEWQVRLQGVFPSFPRPTDITAFRPDFATHGRFGEPCPVCGAPIQRIVHAENETNYCARCQNEGRLLADRSLSRLLKDDWPKTLEELMAD